MSERLCLERAATAGVREPLQRVNCPGCGRRHEGPSVEEYCRFSLYCCQGCGLQFWHPVEVPDAAWHEMVYQGRDQHVMPLEPGHQFFLSSPRAPKSGSLLDVGCGTGNFLSATRAAGYDVIGIELNQNAARFARKRLGLDVLPLRLEDFVREHPDRRFDAVTFFEVLEHQDKPQAFLKLAKSCLKSGGYLALSVPNRERWQEGTEVLDYPPNHLTRWNARTLNNFLTAQGFEILAICEEPLSVRRAAQVLSMKLRTGLVTRIAGEKPPSPSDLWGMKPQDIQVTLERTSRSVAHQVAFQLVRLKNYALLPAAVLMLPYFRFRGYKGAYLSCLARLKN